MNFVEWLQVIIALVGILFLPGYFLTIIFFPKENKKLDPIERFLLSFALSMAIVPLLIFFLNKAGLNINQINVIIIVVSVLVIEVIYLFIKSRKRKLDSNPKINDSSS